MIRGRPSVRAVGSIVGYAMDAGSAETVWLSDVSFGADVHVYNFYW